MSDPVDLRGSRRRPALPDAAPNRLPPHSSESEQGILGCFFHDPNTIAEAQAKIPTSEVFFDLKHRTLYETITEMRDEGAPIDTITIMARLKAFGQLDSMGGAAFVSGLPDMVPGAANCGYYINVVLEKYMLRRMIQTASDVISRAYEHEGEVGEILDYFESEAMKVRIHEGQVITANCKAAADAAIAQIETMVERKGALAGISSGLPSLDRITGGFVGGQMIVVAGLSSQGKTSLGMGFVEAAVVDSSTPVGCISLEMSETSLLVRMLCSRARLNIKNVRDGFISERDITNIRQAHRALRAAPLYIDAGLGQSITQISAKARRLKQQFGIKMLVIDYLQLVRPAAERGDSRQVEVANISNSIKRLACELDIPIIVMVQMNNLIEKEKRKPRLSDLRESSAIGHDADICLCLYAPPTDDEETDSVPMNLRVVKHRSGQANIDIRLLFQKQFTKFVELARVEDSDVPQESLPIQQPP